MEEIYEIVKTPQWWITVVIAGIGINLISSYLKSLLDGHLSRISKWWRNRSQEKKKEYQAYTYRLASDQQFLLLNSIRHVRSVKFAVIWVLLGLMGFLSAQGVNSDIAERILMLLASIAFIRGFQHMFKASYYSSSAEEAIENENT